MAFEKLIPALNVQYSADVTLPQLQKVFLPPGTGFLRRNFPNIDDEFS